MHGPSPAGRVATLDLGLRPEGGQGRLARDLHGYRSYFERWAETWERQALLRARVVAGDRALGARFTALVDDFVWDRPVTEDDVAAIRRMKARIERERIPAREDPQFHLKLGRGSLSDIEWTVQLLQLVHAVPGTSTHSPPWRCWASAARSARSRPMALRRGLPVLRAHPQPLAPGGCAARGGIPGRRAADRGWTSSRTWRGASAHDPDTRCATTTAASPGGPDGWWSRPSTG